MFVQTRGERKFKKHPEMTLHSSGLCIPRSSCHRLSGKFLNRCAYSFAYLEISLSNGNVECSAGSSENEKDSGLQVGLPCLSSSLYISFDCMPDPAKRATEWLLNALRVVSIEVPSFTRDSFAFALTFSCSPHRQTIGNVT